ncbi:GNAT family N-acetyltransferase [Undibacterium sp. Rencai35W]|uniref:GNAT family N-acetyltransferase n=1 Tax=Undibacterium sp. Rencai35W TaxID=3413046 RepID=UPI003BF3D0DB
MIFTDNQVAICVATKADLYRIENMMQFYNYDFSEWHDIDLSETGLFRLQPKEAYWSQSNVKPFLIKMNDKLAGFAVIDDELTHDSSNYNLDYFFILRRYRGKGIAQAAIELLLNQFKGNWEIYSLRQNAIAEKFWRKILTQFLGYVVESTDIKIHGEDSCLFRFNSMKTE